MICGQEACRDARSVRPFHSKCVHIYVVLRADARAVHPYTPWTWSNPTPFAMQSRLYGCVKRFVLSRKPDFWSTFPWLMFFKKEIKKTDKKAGWGCNMCTVIFHSLSSYFTIWLISLVNSSYFVSRNEPLRQSKWLILMCCFSHLEARFSGLYEKREGLSRPSLMQI